MTGLAAARTRGRVGGRRRALSARQRAVAQTMYDARTYSVQAIADHFGVSGSTIYRTLVIPASPAAGPRGSELEAQAATTRCSECGRLGVTIRSFQTDPRTARCRQCSYVERGQRRAVPKPGSELAVRYPGLTGEWHPTKNGTLTAHDVGYASNFKRWWLCSVGGTDCEGEWEASPGDRTSIGRGGLGCPSCGQRRGKLKQQVPKSGNELAVRDPDVAGEWHPTKNGTVTPHDVSYASHVARVWLCRVCGHDWPTTPQNRCIGWKTGCPRCSMWGTSAQEIRLRHELAAAGCPVEHPYPPIEVSGRRPVKGDVVCPTWRVVVEFDGYQFHRRAANVERDLNQTHALEGAGWTVIRVREELALLGRNDVQIRLHASEVDAAKAVVEQLAKLGFDPPGVSRYLKTLAPWAKASADTEIHRVLSYSLATAAPALAAEFHPTKNGTVTTDQVHPGSNTAYQWLCGTCGHDWPASPVIRRNHGCKVCGHKRTAQARARPEPGQSLADLHPELAKQWHPIKNGDLRPDQLKPGSNREVWWLCGCGHEWDTKVSHRTTGHGCEVCGHEAHARPEPGRSLADLYPELAKDWHPTKNGDHRPDQYRPGSGRQVWWLCRGCGHQWETPVAQRTGGKGCNVCRHRPEPGRSLADLYPELMAEWHPTRNIDLRPDQLKPKSARLAWWLCSQCGRAWRTRVAHRTAGHGCSCGHRPEPGRS